MLKLIAITFLVFTLSTHGAKLLPNYAHPDAKVGGTMKYNLSSQPESLNPLKSNDVPSRRIKLFVMERLGELDLKTHNYRPRLAKSWTISKDGLVFDFTLRDGVKWHDGKPFTAEDVKFSLEAILDKKNTYETAHLRPYFENFNKVEILAPNKVRITAKKKYFRNLESLVHTMWIVPKHLHENADKKMKRKLNKTMVGTGPYKLSKFKRGKYIELKRNKNWWGFKEELGKNRYNFNKMMVRFIEDDTISLQYLSKGKLDVIFYLQSETFYTKLKGPKWGKELTKVKYNSDKPKSYAWIGWNMQSDLFKSKKVRTAMTHLVNRQKMVEKFMFNARVPATGPWDMSSRFADKTRKALKFDPKKAAKLLAEEGWKDTNGNGILDKKINGKLVEFTFTMLEPYKPFRKYQVIIQEEMKKVGVDMKIKIIEWASFLKLVDEKKFDAIRMAWGAGSVNNDAKQIWHSDSINNKGSNYVSYSNPQVDKLIMQSRTVLDSDKREPIMKKIYRLIADDQPYTFLFNKKYDFYAVNSKIGRPKDSYRYDIGFFEGYWWYK